MPTKDISNENKNIFSFEDMLCRALKLEKEKSRPPQKVYVDAQKHDEYVSNERFKEMFKRYVGFVEKHGRIPRFITVDPTAPAPTPASCCDTGFFKQDYQDTGYSCGASSMKMALSAFGIYASEQEIMRIAGTTTHGTTHDGMIRAARHYGLRAWFKNFSDSNWRELCDHIKNGGEIILHIMTHKLRDDCRGNTVWRGAYGHYIYLTKVCTADKIVWVADPTKGLRCHTFNQMEQAMAAVTWAPSVMFLQTSRVTGGEPIITAKSDRGPNDVIGEQGLGEGVISDYILLLGLKSKDEAFARRLFEEGRVKLTEEGLEQAPEKLDLIVDGDEVFVDPEMVIARLEEAKGKWP